MKSLLKLMFQGIASIDFFPGMNMPEILTDREALEADREAIRKDWQRAIGNMRKDSVAKALTRVERNVSKYSK